MIGIFWIIMRKFIEIINSNLNKNDYNSIFMLFLIIVIAYYRVLENLRLKVSKSKQLDQFHIFILTMRVNSSL